MTCSAPDGVAVRHGERVVYDNRWVQLALVDVEPPGVERFEHHVVRLFRVAVAAILDDADRVLMLCRYRFVPDKIGWELPGGIIDAGETPAQAAAREVEEETGWRPTMPLRHLITFQPMVGMVDSPHDLFIGQGAEFVKSPPVDAEEAGQAAWVPLRELRVRREAVAPCPGTAPASVMVRRLREGGDYGPQER